MRILNSRSVAVFLVIMCFGVGIASTEDEIFTDGFEWGSICAWNNNWYPDVDVDLWGDVTATGMSVNCPAPSGWVPNNGDCDDLDSLVHPGAAEVCDASDNDCNDLIDDGNLCDTGWSCCGGSCLDTAFDPDHCGACGNICDLLNTDAHSCGSGECQIAACDSGFGNCNSLDADGCEVDTSSEISNCGACGFLCDLSHTDSHTCSGGECLVSTCDADYENCNTLDVDGCEVNIGGDATNCGSCGYQCSLANAASHACVLGECEVHSCSGTFENCNDIDSDGCEIDLDSDLNNCGGCGQVCDLPHAASHNCVGGMCQVLTCDQFWGNCNDQDTDGCEKNLTSDVLNCGTCGNTCPGYGYSSAHVSCQSGGCQFSCSGERYDVDGNPGNGCEISDAPLSNHTQSSAFYEGSFSCNDGSGPNIAGKIISDERTHEYPSVAGFDPSSGSAPDWYRVYASGGFCNNDIDLELQVNGSTCPTGYRLTVHTDIHTRTCNTNSGGYCRINFSTGEYSDDTSIYIVVSKTASTSCRESKNYTVTGHL